MADDTQSGQKANEARFSSVESTIRLVERAQAGDEEALNLLMARHVRPLKRWASGRLPRWARDSADTDDLVQDTLLQTFKRIQDFEPRGAGALQVYLRQAVLNRIKDELRRKSRRPAMPELDGLEGDTHRSSRRSGARRWTVTSAR